MGRDTTEYLKQTIIEALNNNSCAICHVVKESEEKSFRWFLIENYHEAPMLSELADNSFFCDYHANILENSGHSSVSVAFQFLVQCDINRLDALKKVNNSTSQKKSFFNLLSDSFQRSSKSEYGKIIDQLFHGYTSCRFCKLNEDFTNYVQELFAELIREDVGFKDLYLKSHGLCRRHFIEVIKLCNDEVSSEFLLNDMIHRLNRMQNDFDLYFHKLDYRFSDEPKGEEQSTWLRALKYYSSSKMAGSSSP